MNKCAYTHTLAGEDEEDENVEEDGAEQDTAEQQDDQHMHANRPALLMHEDAYEDESNDDLHTNSHKLRRPEYGCVHCMSVTMCTLAVFDCVFDCAVFDCVFLRGLIGAYIRMHLSMAHNCCTQRRHMLSFYMKEKMDVKTALVGEDGSWYLNRICLTLM